MAVAKALFSARVVYTSSDFLCREKIPDKHEHCQLEQPLAAADADVFSITQKGSGTHLGPVGAFGHNTHLARPLQMVTVKPACELQIPQGCQKS